MESYISVTEYSELTGLSKTQIYTMIENGELKHTTSAGGKKYFIAKPIAAKETTSDDEVRKMLIKLCEHLGVKI